METVLKTTLENGIRVLCEPITYVGSASIGLWCVTGSANEHENEAGITHFIEHMLFKGTKTRTSKQLAEEIEGRGGMLNAFTDKESTCYYARVLDRDVETAIDVLCEMVTGSLLDEKELETEKGVVLEEIKRGEDEPSDHVHDLHMEDRWNGHVLGKPVIGTSESVSSFKNHDLRRYMARRYTGGQIVLAVAGNIDPARVAEAARSRLSSIAPGTDQPKMPPPQGRPGKREVSKDVEQVHFCIGGEAPSLYDEDRYIATVLDGVLGGGMSSRLFQEVRERRGLAYAIGAYTLTYTAGGAFTVYGGTGRDKWQEVQEVVAKEFDKVRKEGANEDELAKVKLQISGNMVLALESMSTRMMRMARNEIIFGRSIPIEEVLKKIDAVTNDQLISHARKAIEEKVISTTAIGPFG